MLKKVTLCLVAVALLAGAVVYAAHHEGDYEKLGEMWQAAYNDEGAAAVAALYMEDGMRMPPDMPTVEGREAIQAQVQAGMDMGLAKVEIEMVESMVTGELGVARGRFKTMGADGETMSEGKWISMSKFVDGKWQIYADIWNMDAPMAMPE